MSDKSTNWEDIIFTGGFALMIVIAVLGLVTKEIIKEYHRPCTQVEVTK